MKASVASFVMLMGGLSAAKGQTVIAVPASGAPIVNGGTYPAGTVYANGVAYPPGTVVQASAPPTTEVISSSPAFISYSDYGGVYYAGYPYVGRGYGYGGWGRGYCGGWGGGFRGGRR